MGKDQISVLKSICNFYNDEEEKEIAQELIDKLKERGYQVVTKLIPAKEHKFYKRRSIIKITIEREAQNLTAIATKRDFRRRDFEQN